MRGDTYIKIVNLIEEKMGKYRNPLIRETTLERDLGMTGDDAIEFILEFSQRFNVDISQFNIRLYFEPEGDSILPNVFRSITGKKKSKQKELTIGDLEHSVMKGKLE